MRPSAIREQLAAWRRDARGVAAVEFACAAPLFSLALVGIAELGLAVRTRLAAEEAVAAGAQSALKSSNVTVIAAAVQNANPGFTILASPAPAPFYGCPAVTGLTRTVQGTTCADGRTARQFVDVSATVVRPTVFGPKFGATTLTAHVTARLQ